MSRTALDLITSSLRLIGALASGETPSASEGADALVVLNDLLETWSTEKLLIPNIVREVFPLVPNQAAYTMGPSGNFNTTRAMRIENAELQIPNGQSTLEFPIEVVTKEQYAPILLKQLATALPCYLYPEGTFPQDTLNIWPVPAVAYNIALYSWKQLTALASLTTALSFPPAYARALRFNLAVELTPEYGKALREDVISLAAESKGAIKRLNSRPRYLSIDPFLATRGGSIDGGWGGLLGGQTDDAGSVDGGTF